MSGGRRPDFVIIGAMKSATSTLHTQLAAQPGFFMSTPKEPNFFSDADIWARGLDWYEGLFAGAAPDELCGDSRTHYTKLPDLPDALPRLREYLPGAKLIYVMRHPVDRLVSHYIHAWSERTIDGAIDQAIDEHPALVDYGRYAMQIGPYLEAFGKDAVLPLFFERMLREPQAELERVCKFLGYRRIPHWEHEVRANVSGERLRRSALRDALVLNPLATFIRRNFIPQSVRDRVKAKWQMREKPALGPDALAKVTARFDSDLARLGPLLGVELNCGNFKSAVTAAPLNWV